MSSNGEDDDDVGWLVGLIRTCGMTIIGLYTKATRACRAGKLCVRRCFTDVASTKYYNQWRSQKITSTKRAATVGPRIRGKDARSKERADIWWCIAAGVCAWASFQMWSRSPRLAFSFSFSLDSRPTAVAPPSACFICPDEAVPNREAACVGGASIACGAVLEAP
jgi:hypothetical protein